MKLPDLSAARAAYQGQLVADLRAAHGRLRARGVACPRLLGYLPTGGGKTHVFVALCQGALRCGGRPMLLAHREELVLQAAGKLRGHGLRVGVVMADHPTDDGAPVLVCSVQTLTARGYAPDGVTHVFPDEGHHMRAATWRALLGAYGGGLRAVVALTATPACGDGGGLGDVFDELVLGPSVARLVELGALSPILTLRPPHASATFARDPLELVLLHRGEPTVVFCESVEESRGLVARAQAAGVAICHVDGSTRDRSALLAGLGSTYTAVSNADVLTEGWDWPEATVCVLARRCGSVVSLLQRAGRVMRHAPGKGTARLYDLCGVTHDLGCPDEERDWHLGEGSGAPRARVALTTCRKCFAAYPPSPTCPAVLMDGTVCGYRNPPPKPRRVKFAALEPAVKEAIFDRRDPVAWLARTMVQARERGWKRGAVERRFEGWAKRRPKEAEIALARERADGAPLAAGTLAALAWLMGRAPQGSDKCLGY